MPDGWRPLPLGDHVLAESPRWDPRTTELAWVDVATGTLCVSRFLAGTGWTAPTRRTIGAPLTAVATRPDPADGWIVATGTGLSTVSRTGRVRALCELVDPSDQATVRTNDLTADAAGRLYVGLLHESRSVAGAALLRVDLDGAVSVAVPGMVAANGLGFSPDQRVLYVVDSVPRTLTAYPYDVGSGRLGTGDVIATWPGPGTFDGLVVGADGHLWVAVWDAGVVCRLGPGGSLLRTVPAPVSRPTALALAGPDQRSLILTTARTDLAPRTDPTPGPDGRLYELRLPDQPRPEPH